MIDRPWNGAGKEGKLFLVEDPSKCSIGMSWMAGRLKRGDVAIIVGHSGDGFHDYCLLEKGFYFTKNGKTVPGAQIINESKFGAYYVGRELTPRLSKKDFHLLMAGEMIEFNYDVQVH